MSGNQQKLTLKIVWENFSINGVSNEYFLIGQVRGPTDSILGNYLYIYIYIIVRSNIFATLQRML